MNTYTYCEQSATIRETSSNANVAVFIENRWVIDLDPTVDEQVAVNDFATLFKRPEKRYLTGTKLVAYLNKSIVH